MVIELITFKIYEIAESSNTARELPLLIIFEQPNTLKLNSNKSCFYQEIFSSWNGIKSSVELCFQPFSSG